MNPKQTISLKFSEKDYVGLSLEDAANLSIIKENFVMLTIAQFHWMMSVVKNKITELSDEEVQVYARLKPDGSYNYEAKLVDLVWLFNKAVEFSKNNVLNKANSY